MEIEVEHQDGNKNINLKKFNLSTLGLIKHFGLAGQSYGTTIRAIRRAIGVYFFYYDYFKRKDIINSRFSKPANYFYDPTDQGDFSTVAGRAIADFLARRIDGATHTITYEGAMLLDGWNDFSVSRADLYCFNSCKQFAVEAKGYDVKTVSENEMKVHKIQSGQGPIKNIDFSVASVSYNLYNKIKNKYYDPKRERSEFNIDLNTKISSQYYSGFAELLKEQKDFPSLNFSDQNREFYLIPIYSSDNELISYEKVRIRKYYRPNTVFLVLDKRIMNFALEGFVKNEERDVITDDGLYIDNDGIGLMRDYY